MGDLLRKIDYGVCSLLKDRAFTLTALLTLAVYIAVNTAIFASRRQRYYRTRLALPVLIYGLALELYW